MSSYQTIFDWKVFSEPNIQFIECQAIGEASDACLIINGGADYAYLDFVNGNPNVMEGMIVDDDDSHISLVLDGTGFAYVMSLQFKSYKINPSDFFRL